MAISIGNGAKIWPLEMGRKSCESADQTVLMGSLICAFVVQQQSGFLALKPFYNYIGAVKAA